MIECCKEDKVKTQKNNLHKAQTNYNNPKT
jgi:hypothetical protein